MHSIFVGQSQGGQGREHPPLVIPSDARRNTCLQEHSADAAHEPQQGEVSEDVSHPSVIPRSFCDEESHGKGQSAKSEEIPHIRSG